MSYRTEFPDFDHNLPYIDGFIDASWHNDTMPHLTNGLVDVWCNYRNPALREFEDSNLYLVTSADHDNGGITIFETDSIDALHAFLRTL